MSSANSGDPQRWDGIIKPYSQKDDAPFADVLWCETSEPNLEEAKQFAAAVHEKYPRNV
jgi:hypothetical protein